jgi:hypothetical protein
MDSKAMTSFESNKSANKSKKPLPHTPSGDFQVSIIFARNVSLTKKETKKSRAVIKSYDFA